MSRMIRIISALLVFYFGIISFAAEAPYPAFVFGHWVWLDESTSDSVRELVRGYRERGIPVSAVIIDSPWETAYNTFEFDKGLYPDHERLLRELDEQGIAVILWITCAVNFEDPDYEFALERSYFKPGFEEYKWWKGTGGLIDYENPEALNWWHSRMDRVMDLPFDGWKVDGIDGLMALRGWNMRNEYARRYYSDFHNYTRERTGRKTVIMARGIELFNEHTLSFPGWVNPLKLSLPLRYAPREVSFATWMGDQDPTWNGMRAAYRSFTRSAEAGYLVVGFDIFGYRGGEPDKELFLRWAQWGAFSPLMENGGIAEHRPWAYDEETVKIYRQYTIMHEELGWYMYSAADSRFMQGRSMVEPVKEGYMLGGDIYVKPIMKPGADQVVELPEGCWRNFNDIEERYCSGEKLRESYTLSEYPVFLSEAAAVPLWVRSGYSGQRLNEKFASQDTLWLLPGEGGGSKELIYLEGQRAGLEWRRTGEMLELEHDGPCPGLVILVEDMWDDPDQVLVSGEEVPGSNCREIKPGGGSAYCMKEGRLWIKLGPIKGSFDLKVEY